MKENVLNFLNKCEGWKTAIKNSHWSSENLSEHKLFDEIADSLSDIEDVTAEIEQGLHGKINKNELKPTSYTIEGSKKIISDILKDTEDFYSSIKEGEEYIGMRSEIEAFIGELNKYQYLMGLALKEDFKRNFNKKLNENKKNVIKLTEAQLHQVIKESVNRILKENYPLGAANDPRAPYNQPDDSWVYEEIDKEIDTLDQTFIDWVVDKYVDGYDEFVSNEEIAANLAEDPNIRDEYADYRYEDIVTECEEPDYDAYDEWRDRQYE